MTTEDDFHAALDAQPEDWQTRLVFADWLQEQGDPRAEGYRALGLLGVAPMESSAGLSYGADNDLNYGYTHDRNVNIKLGAPHYALSALPPAWYEKFRPHNAMPQWKPDHWAYLPSRREAEDAAARAFTELPAAERARILAPPVGGARP